MKRASTAVVLALWLFGCGKKPARTFECGNKTRACAIGCGDPAGCFQQVEAFCPPGGFCYPSEAECKAAGSACPRVTP